MALARLRLEQHALAVNRGQAAQEQRRNEALEAVEAVGDRLAALDADPLVARWLAPGLAL